MIRSVLVAVAFVALTAAAHAETGYNLWLRYERVTDPAQLRAYRQAATAIVVQQRSPTSDVIAAELRRGLSGLLGVDVSIADQVSTGAVVAGTPSGSPVIAALGWAEALARLGSEGYLIRSAIVDGHDVTVIASSSAVTPVARCGSGTSSPGR